MHTMCMRRPHLTKKVIQGLYHVIGEMECNIDVRRGWGDDLPEDLLSEHALEYLRRLIKVTNSHPRSGPNPRRGTP